MRPGVEAAWCVLLFAAAGLLFTVGAGRIGFQNADERTYAQVGREVGSGSAFMVLHHLGAPYPERPPLCFWIEAAAYRLLRRADPFAARLPQIAFALAALLFAYLAMRRIDGPRVALIGTAALLVAFRFFYEARRIGTDVPLCAFLWGAFWASTHILFPPRGREGGGVAWAWTGWTLAALAALAGGVGALVWPGTLVAYAIASRRYEPLRRHWFWPGLAWMLAAVALWFVPAATMGGADYYGPMLRLRLAEGFHDVMRDKTWLLYYFYKLPADALPLGLMLPASLWWAWRRRRGFDDGGRTRFAVCWLVFGFVLFSLPRHKHGADILPVYPALALLAARLIRDAFRARLPRRVVFAHAWLASLLALLAVPATIALFRFRPQVFPIDPPSEFMIALLAVLTLGGGTAGALLRHRRLGGALAGLGATAYLAYLALFVGFMPELHNDRLPRRIAEDVNQRLAAGEPVGCFKLDNAALFYLKAQPRWLATADAARAFMAHEDQRWLLTTLGGLEPGRNPGWPIARQWSQTAEGDPVVMLSNRVPKLPEVLYESSDTSETLKKSEKKPENRDAKSETNSKPKIQN